jgi:hypothetical protein
MRKAAVGIVLGLGLFATRAPAQTRPEANLMLELFGGITTGSGLWEINRQPLTVRGTEAFPMYDSLRIVRRLEPGLVLGASASVFPHPTLGFTAEVMLLSLPVADDCTLAFHNTGVDLLERNQQMCVNLADGAGAATTVTVSAGGIFRLAPRGYVSPFLRAEVGLSIRNSSTVEVESEYIDFDGSLSPPFVIVFDPNNGTHTFPSGGVGGGLMIPFAPGYQVRLEVRDNMTLLERITGPASNVAIAPTERFLHHAVGLLVGLDVVLEQKRGRRY